MRWLLSFVALAGCDAAFSLVHVDDVPVDASVDDAPTTGCFGKYGAGNAGLFSQCLDAPPREVYVPANGELVTSVAENCDFVVNQTGGPSVCVIVAQNITLGGTLSARGSGIPLVVIATDTLKLLESAKISVDSRHGELRLGAGANDTACMAPGAGAQPMATQGGGGGAGGSLGTVGGVGGGGYGATGGGVPGLPLATLAAVRGGCRGGGGGVFGAPATGGGASGGAVYLIAGRELVVAGTIDASGEGGDGGKPSGSTSGGGGGAGGSGGLIALDAPHITLASTARLVANGGGGGAGADGGTGGAAGQDGNESDLAGSPPFVAAGGEGAAGGGAGGQGANVATAASPGGSAKATPISSGGGGGGGGAGLIKLYSTQIDDQGAVFSPAQS
jgi:hypothetical protein